MKTSELRLFVADAVGKAEPSELRERLRRELRRNSDSHSPRRRQAAEYAAKVAKWATDHLVPALDPCAPDLLGFEAYKAFLRHETGNDDNPGKPRLFYRVLEDMGWALRHDGVQVVLPGAEIAP